MLLLLEVWELPGGGQPSKGIIAISQMGMKDISEWRWKERRGHRAATVQCCPDLGAVSEAHAHSVLVGLTRHTGRPARQGAAVGRWGRQSNWRL